jgi:hypothetical protein
MSKLGRLWDWLLPGLISLSQMGGFAYYVVEEAADHEPRSVVLHVLAAA